jgi:signal transduction histidine kinase
MKINFLNKKNLGVRLLVPATIFVVLMLVLLVQNLIQIKKNQLQNSLAQDATAVENVLLEKFNATLFVIDKMGEEIAEKPEDKVYIKKVLEKYKADTSLKQIFSWTIFSWANPEGKLLVDSEYGIMKEHFDLSIRDYFAESLQKPQQFILGEPVHGSTSKRWMIPGGVSVVDENQNSLGEIVTGFEIEKLAKVVQEVIKNEDISVELVYKDQRRVFDISKSAIEIFTKEKAKEVSSKEKQITLVRELKNYPYYLVLKYDNKAVSSILWEVIYSRIIEILAVILTSLTLLFLVYRSEKEKSIMMQHEVVNKLRSEFIFHVSHELKNFIAAIISLSDIVKESFKDGELKNHDFKEQIGHLDHIDDIGKELTAFIVDLTDLNHSENGKFEVIRSSTKIDFEDVIDRSVRILRNKIKDKGISVNTVFDSELNKISNLDERRIKQILVSIIGNAVKYSPKASKIEIFARNLDRKKIEITVKDCGSGMSDSQIKSALRNHNFKRINDRNKINSIELKLPIVRFLVEKQGGTIEIESNKHYGTKVRVIF